MSSLLPPGFPAVPHDLNHSTVTPGPSQNRTWCVTPSGSQFESSPVWDLWVKRVSPVVMVFVRSVSAHVSLTCSLKPTPLCSARITRLHRSYGCLRLPATSHLPRFLHLSDGPPFPGRSSRISLVTTQSQCEARHGLRPRGGTLHSPLRAKSCCLLDVRHHRPIPNALFSGLNTFTVGFTRYHCTSPPLLPTHQA